jgi:pullulanase/glycogen debranching enzyme
MDENLKHPDWDNISKRSIAFALDGSVIEQPDNDFFVIFNAGIKDTRQKIPAPPGNKAWYQAINTYLDDVEGIPPAGKEPLVSSDSILIKPRSSIVLLTR